MVQQTLRIALTPGAEDGVGPELLIEALSHYKQTNSLQFFWCGDRASLELGAKRAKKTITTWQEKKATLADGLELNFSADIESSSMLERQARFLEISVELAKNGLVDAIVTGPIQKAALRFLKGGPFLGQTEFFGAYLSRGEKPFMSFMGAPFMLSLLTTHLPLSEVSCAITEELLFGHLKSVARHYASIHHKKISDTKIVVLGVNPHAGEDGLIGSEEQRIFKPAILRAQKDGLNIQGPVPADGFFAYFHRLSGDARPDVVVAAYHDQGLSPYKLLAQGGAVNVTLGLKVPRISPAHGTAPELVGKGLACPLSTEMALKTVIELAAQH